MTNSRVIQCLWIGNKIGKMERLCLRSFIKNLYVVHLYTYNEIHDLPAGVLLKDANLIIAAEKIFKYKYHDSYAGFANLFRYKLLFEKGGFWSDLDIVCMKPFSDNMDFIFTTERMKGGGYQFNNCFLYVPPFSAIMEFCYNVAKTKDPDKLQWGETGPKLLTEAILSFDMLEFALDPDVICGINWWEVEVFVSKPLDKVITEETYGIHFFNECWKRKNLNKELQYSKHSAYEQLSKLFEVT